MTRFRCVPIDTGVAERFRRSGVDDRGNALRRMTADKPYGFPCRHCLECAQPGQDMLLGSYDLPRPRGIYWTPSPVFVHAAPCPAFDAVDTLVPTVVANGLISVRAYDGADQVIYDLGHVCEGRDAHGPLRQALEDVRTAFVNIHTARPGCLLARVERVRSPAPA